MWRGLFKGYDSYHSPKPVPGNVLLTRCGEWGGEAGPCCGRVSAVSVSDGAVVCSHGGQDVVAFTAVYVQCACCVQLSRRCSASPVVLSASSSAATASRSPTGMCLMLICRSLCHHYIAHGPLFMCLIHIISTKLTH